MTKFKMRGVIPPMVTPFEEDGAVSYTGLKQLVGYLKNEVDGLFINGSYGAGILMQPEERMKTAEVVMKETAGKIPVIVHIGAADTATSARLAAHATSIGADAVSAVGPFYFKHNDDQICSFYEGILKAAGQTPVYVYNNHQFQGYQMSLNLIRRLKELGVAGIKDATFDIMLHANYQRLFVDDDFDIALGTEAMWLSACVLGCKSFIPGLGNAFPEICRKMYEEGIAGDYAACKETQFTVNKLRDVMYLARSTQLAIYAMLEIRGILKAYPRSPFIPASDQEKENIRKELVQMHMI